MRQRLSAAQVAELAELLEDGPWRIGPVEEVLEAATEGRGMTLVLTDRPLNLGSLSERSGRSRQ